MCNNGFGGCSWIIILILILCCCGCGNSGYGNNGCGCNDGCAFPFIRIGIPRDPLPYRFQ